MSFTKDFLQQVLDSRKFILPILITISLTAILTISYNNALIYFDQDPQDIAPVTGPDDVVGDPGGAIAAGLSNAIIYVFIALIGGFFLVFLIRTGKIKILELIFASMMGFATFIFGYSVFWTIPLWIFTKYPFTQEILSSQIIGFILNEFMIILSLTLGILSFLVLGLNRFRSQKIHNLLMILFGSLMGVIFGINFGTTSLFFVLLALAVYDIYAVFWGPIKKMFSPIPEKNHNNITTNVKNANMTGSVIEAENLVEINPTEDYEVEQSTENIVYPQKNSAINEKYIEYQPMPISLPVYHTPEISIGLGDFVFFSVLVSKSFYEGLINNNVWLFLLPFLGILIGSFLTFRMLEKYEILPALPIPILVGTLGFILALVLEYSPNIL